METVLDFLNKLAARGIRLSVDGDKLNCYSQAGALSGEIKNDILRFKPAIIELYKSRKDNLSLTGAPGFAKQALNSAEFRLSSGAKGIYILQKMHPLMSAYNIPLCFKLSGAVNTAALDKAWLHLFHQYPILTAKVVERDGDIFYCLSNDNEHPLESVVADFFELQKPSDFLQQLVRKPFVANKGPLIRGQLLSDGEKDVILLITVHHLIFDEASSAVLLASLCENYQQLCGDTAASISVNTSLSSRASLGYRDFIAEEELLLASIEGKAHELYWSRQLDGELPILRLLSDLPKSVSTKFAGKRLVEPLPSSSTAWISAFAQDTALPVQTLFLGLFKLLLHKYTNQDDIIVGVNSSLRDTRFAQDVGYFENILPLRSSLANNIPLVDYLRAVETTRSNALDHGNYPFPLMLNKLKLNQSDKDAVFQISFAYRDLASKRHLETLMDRSTLGLELLKGVYQDGNFDLGIEIYEEEKAFIVHLEYNAERYTQETIKYLFDHYCVLLQEVAKDSSRSIQDYPVLSEQERDRLLNLNNETRVDYPANKCLHQLFVDQVAINPQKIAVVYQDEQLSYQKLYEKSHELALYIQSLGVKPDTLIGLCVERSTDMLVSLLGILQAGCAYVPLDPEYPEDRLAYMLSDCEAKVILTQEKLQSKLSSIATVDTRFVILDKQAKEITTIVAAITAKKIKLQKKVKPHHLAYVIYTSGSTGNPKGVMIEHKSLVNFLSSMADKLNIHQDDKLLALTTYCFDIAGLEMYLPLICGAQVSICPSEVIKDGDKLKALIEGVGPTVMQATPATWQLLFYAGWRNQQRVKILCGGEALSESLKKDFMETGSEVWNMYGPTETTVWSTMGSVAERQLITIGSPIANTHIYILDEHNQLQPMGIPGELHIAGDGLARGYLNKPELTQEKFVNNPFVPGTRMYKTGDLARWLPDARLECLGRIDNQVKIRGFRIELGDIETHLSDLKSVKDSAVVAKKNDVGDRSLIAYLVLDQLTTADKNITQEDDYLSDEQVKQWEDSWSRSYLESVRGTDPRKNFSGWDSSYTKHTIPVKEMNEWLSAVVDRILVQKPGQVLEIGCGTGLILFQVASCSSHYYGIDFSQQALDYIHQTIGDAADDVRKVSLLRSAADNLSQLESIKEKTFDTVIINSVIQYFPDVDYLLAVMKQAVEKTNSKGRLFIGDVRHLGLLPAFRVSIEAHNAKEMDKPLHVLQKVQQQLFYEKELLIDPRFFSLLSKEIPRISRVQILPKPHFQNKELCNYRYDVVLHIDEVAADAPEIHWMDWQQDQLDLDVIQSHLVDFKPDILGVARVANSRVAADDELWRLLKEEGHSRKSFRGLMEAAGESAISAIDPVAVLDIAATLPYVVDIDWSQGHAHGEFDVILRRVGSQWEHKKLNIPSMPRLATEQQAEKTYQHYANIPMQGSLAHKLVPEFKENLAKKLPEYMLPSRFVFLEKLPLTPNGKVDRRALEAIDINLKSSQAYVAPRNYREQKLVEIWAQVLNLEPEKVGVNDNFFELGGHSLLAAQLMTKIETQLKQSLPLAVLFTAPTVAALAELTVSDEISSYDILVPMQRKGDKVAIFAIPGADGGVLPFMPLCRFLGNRQPFYGLQAVGFDGRTLPLDNVEKAAMANINAMQALQPNGPYRIIGYSNGGVVAFEMARLLLEQGQQIESLMLLDTLPPEIRVNDQVTEIGRVCHSLESTHNLNFNLDIDELRQVPENQRRDYLFNIMTGSGFEITRRQFDINYDVAMASDFSCRNHTTSKISSPLNIILYRADKGFDNMPFDYGWNNFLSDPITIVDIEADHFSIVREGPVQKVTQNILQSTKNNELEMASVE